MKSIAFACLLASAVSVSGGCATLVDLRTAEVADGISPEERERGVALLSRAMAAHGGRESWAAGGPARFVVADVWPSLLTRAVAMPWPQSPQRMELLVDTGRDNARLVFLDGDRAGEGWGIQGWETYAVDTGKTVVFRDDEQIRFWVPTLVYFLELPFRLAEAPIVADAGPVSRGDRRYERVFATWGAPEPQAGLDQYVLWIDAETGRMTFVEYTIRDWGGFLRGGMLYMGEQIVDGIVFPKRLQAQDAIDASDPLHVIDVESIELNAPVPASLLVPDPNRTRPKHRRPD